MNNQAEEDDPEAQQQPQKIHNIVSNDMDWIVKPRRCEKKKILIGGLAISNIRFCQNRQQMQKHQIKAVLSVCGDKLQLPLPVQHLWIVVDDHPKEQISTFFNSACLFIDQNLQNGNVLVHCRAGISRSTSIVIAYLIRKNSMPYQSALQLVQTARPITNPNKGFIKQLKKYAKDNLNKNEKIEVKGRQLQTRIQGNNTTGCINKDSKSCQVF